MANPEALKGDQSQVIPSVKYDKKLGKPDVSYAVKVDQELYKSLLNTFGMSDEQINKLKTKINKFGYISDGAFSIRNEIFVNTENPWNRWIKRKNTKEDLVKKQKHVVEVILHESKHALDLKDKKKRIVVILFQYGIIGAGTFALYHFGGNSEISKMLNSEIWGKIVSGLSDFAVTSYFSYHFNPFEISARKFADRNKNDYQWKNIITITPKQK
jgi:hypothetical protein